jgi:biopolymer transport protein TolR
MDFSGPQRKAKSDINVTPLIDIVLVLLIVFIVMVPSLSKALLVSVPKTSTTIAPPPVNPQNPPVVISILRGQTENEYQFLLQTAPIQLHDIPAQLKPVLLKQMPGFRKVFLKIDGEVPYQVAVNVMDQIRLASDQAKQETRLHSSVDGGDAKVVVALKN